MKKKLVIFGAGGFGREVQWLIDRINVQESVWDILGFIDDGKSVGMTSDGCKIIGGLEYLLQVQETMAVVCAVGNAQIRKKIIEKCKTNPYLYFPNMVDPSVIMSDKVQMGEGNIICAGTVLTVDIHINDFVIINLNTTIGHDAIIQSYVTIYPNVNVSGMVRVDENCELGTGTQIIQGVHINSQIILGAGTVVISDLEDAGTYVGIPARQVRR